jgi:hypothetical protein
MVTLAERQKAEKLFEAKAGSPVKEKKKKAVFDDKQKGFSKGEKDLYRQVEELKQRELE